jgi:hypothetical protein
MTKTDEEIAALRREVAELKSAQPKAREEMERSAAEWCNEMHQLAEARASRQYTFSRQELRETEAATPTSEVRQIALRDNRAPTGPSSAGAIPGSQTLSNVRGAGGGTGWRNEVPLSNPPGVNWVDRIAIADEVRQRAERKR